VLGLERDPVPLAVAASAGPDQIADQEVGRVELQPGLVGVDGQDPATARVEQPGDAFYRDLQGGRGFIARYLLENVPAGADPLGPENVLVFAMGVMTGVALPGAGRHSVGARSPLTGGFGESESGGFWGAEVKRAGWDAIVVHGASETPVYLWIKEDQPVEFRDASGLWGMTTGECEEAIVDELGDQWVRTCQIGPAGEHLVRFANINNDLNEVAGRTGLGAVMGSKKLKAIAVRGTKKVPVFDPKPVQALAKWVATTLEENHRAFHEFGTGAAMVGKHLQGGLPTLNYQYGEWEPVGEIDAVAVRDKVRTEPPHEGARYTQIAVLEGRALIERDYAHIVVRFWEHEIRDHSETVARIVSDCLADDVDSAVRALADLRRLRPCGVRTALVASALHDGALRRDELRAPLDGR